MNLGGSILSVLFHYVMLVSVYLKFDQFTVLEILVIAGGNMNVDGWSY